MIHFNYISQNIHPKSKIETNDFQRKSFMAAIKTNSVQGFFSFPAKQYFHCTVEVCWLRRILDNYDLHSVRVHADVSSVSIYHSIFTALVVRRKLNLEEQLKLALRTIITDSTSALGGEERNRPLCSFTLQPACTLASLLKGLILFFNSFY